MTFGAFLSNEVALNCFFMYDIEYLTGIHKSSLKDEADNYKKHIKEPHRCPR